MLQVAVQQCFHEMWQCPLVILLMLMGDTGLVLLLMYHVTRVMSFMDQAMLTVETIHMGFGINQLNDLDAYPAIKVNILSNGIEKIKKTYFWFFKIDS